MIKSFLVVSMMFVGTALFAQDSTNVQKESKAVVKPTVIKKVQKSKLKVKLTEKAVVPHQTKDAPAPKKQVVKKDAGIDRRKEMKRTKKK